MHADHREPIDASHSASLAGRWAADLASWAIPDEILTHAPESPWVHPPAMFAVDPEAPAPGSPSSRVALAALAALGETGSVLDIGCGGGGSSVGLARGGAVSELIGVDEQQAMLDNFAAACEAVGVAHRTLQGRWPDVASAAPTADVVVCHHVVYNVADIGLFISALTDHARRRVVVELPMTHPTSPFNPLWHRFWGLDRPTRPTADDFLAVLAEAGIDAQSERFSRPPRKAGLDHDQYVAFVRRRLCLSSNRDHEVSVALTELGPLSNDELMTVWWDTRS